MSSLKPNNTPSASEKEIKPSNEKIESPNRTSTIT